LNFAKNRQYAEAYSDFYPVIFSSVYKKIGNIEDAEDICQEIFISFYNKLDEIENRRKWLYGALRLEVMAYYRKKNPDAADIDSEADNIGMSFVNGFREARIIIHNAIEDMSNYRDDADRALFDLVAVRNFSYEEAGAQLGMSKRQVRYRYGIIVEGLIEYFKAKGINSLEELL
jgi:RNA polymerase sigma factor (sigma-70 family)